MKVDWISGGWKGVLRKSEYKPREKYADLWPARDSSEIIERYFELFEGLYREICCICIAFDNVLLLGISMRNFYLIVAQP